MSYSMEALGWTLVHFCWSIASSTSRLRNRAVTFAIRWRWLR